MQIDIESFLELCLELRTDADGNGAVLHRECVTPDLRSLIDEAYTNAVLAETLPVDAERLEVRVRALWASHPWIDGLEIILVAHTAGECSEVNQRFESGRWERRALLARERLLEEGAIDAGTPLTTSLRAEEPSNGTALRPPVLQPPRIDDQSLEEFGVRSLGAGLFLPDRPVLINARMLEQIIARTVAAGVRETGGGTLGKLIRLPERLPGTTTRIVTLLSASVVDPRHEGEFARLNFDPQALAEAARIAELRERGETVFTAFHTHGWGADCKRCNQSENCPLPACTSVSVQDYQVCEALFPSKATLLPIAGRKPGTPGPRPVLAIHAWRGGAMHSISWRSYSD